MQARDDDFVPFKEGKALYDTLLYLSEGSLETTEGSSSTTGSDVAASEVQSSELVVISGGHCNRVHQGTRHHARRSVHCHAAPAHEALHVGFVKAQSASLQTMHAVVVLYKCV